MDLYTIVFIAFIILMLGIMGGVLLFIMWIDKKIDMKNRMGYSAYLKKDKNTTTSSTNQQKSNNK
jgi:preprotein translocase subunit YajC